MKFSIVIPCYDKFHLTHDLLQDIYHNCPTVYEVLVVDNGGKEEETGNGFKFWERMEGFPLKVLGLEENIGFLRASNYGLKQATGDVVALISNDVRVHKDLPRFAGEIIKTPWDKILLGGRLIDWDSGWNCFDGKIYKYIEGWVLITTKIGWENLGYFDERFAPNDYEDIDFSTTALSLGCEIRQFSPFHGEVVSHIGAQTINYGDERMAQTLRNKKKFEEKWVTRVSP